MLYILKKRAGKYHSYYFLKSPFLDNRLKSKRIYDPATIAFIKQIPDTEVVPKVTMKYFF